jgi:hypothetical protein
MSANFNVDSSASMVFPDRRVTPDNDVLRSLPRGSAQGVARRRAIAWPRATAEATRNGAGEPDIRHIRLTGERIRVRDLTIALVPVGDGGEQRLRSLPARNPWAARPPTSNPATGR